MKRQPISEKQPKPPYLKFPNRSQSYNHYAKNLHKIHPNCIDWNLAVIDFDMEERPYNFGITLSHAIEYKTVDDQHVFLKFAMLGEGTMFKIRQVDSASSFIIVNRETTQKDFEFLNYLSKRIYVQTIKEKFFECELVDVDSRISIRIPSKFLNGAMRKDTVKILHPEKKTRR